MFIFIGNLRNQAGKTNNGRYYKNSKKIKKYEKINWWTDRKEKKNSIPLHTH